MPIPNTPTNQPMIQVGGIWMPVQGLIILVAQITTAGNATEFRQLLGTAAAYTPSGALKYKAYAGKGQTTSATTGNSAQIGYSNNAIGIDQAAAGLVSLKTPGGMSPALANPSMVPLAPQGVASHNAGEIPLYGFEIPNGKYGFATIGSTAAGWVWLYGREEA